MAAKRLSQAQKLEARLEDLKVWEQRKVKDTKKGPKAYTYPWPLRLILSQAQEAEGPQRKSLKAQGLRL